LGFLADLSVFADPVFPVFADSVNSAALADSVGALDTAASVRLVGSAAGVFLAVSGLVRPGADAVPTAGAAAVSAAAAGSRAAAASASATGSGRWRAGVRPDPPRRPERSPPHGPGEGLADFERDVVVCTICAAPGSSGTGRASADAGGASPGAGRASAGVDRASAGVDRAAVASVISVCTAAFVGVCIATRPY
jgi:hypothetical protein